MSRNQNRMGTKALIRKRCQGLTKWVAPRERRRAARIKLQQPTK